MGCGSSSAEGKQIATRKIKPAGKGKEKHETSSDGLEHPQEDETRLLEIWNKGTASKRYEKLHTLGIGGSCSVWAVKNKETGQQFALKIMDKLEDNQELYDAEANVLRCIQAATDHCGVLKLVDAFEDVESYNIITVLHAGGELFDRIADEDKFSEKRAAWLTRQMLAALNHVHEQNVCHRDLKPENFVFETKSAESSMVLIDFGMARVAKDDDSVEGVVGSPYYVAPELLNYEDLRTGKVWRAADMWSVGVIVFLMVCGYPPFNDNHQRIIFEKIQAGTFRFPKRGEDGIDFELSASVMDFISLLLVLDPHQRPTAKQALKHPWVSGDMAPATVLPQSWHKLAKSFNHHSHLKRAVANVMGHHMSPEDKACLEDVYKKFDHDGSNTLGLDELSAFMTYIGKNEVDAKNLLENLDLDKSGQIDATELHKGLQVASMTESKQQMRDAFEKFDIDGDGFVTAQEIEEVCTFADDGMLARIMTEASGGDKSGRVTFEQWCKALGLIHVDEVKEIKKVVTERKSKRFGALPSRPSTMRTIVAEPPADQA